MKSKDPRLMTWLGISYVVFAFLELVVWPFDPPKSWIFEVQPVCLLLAGLLQIWNIHHQRKRSTISHSLSPNSDQDVHASQEQRHRE